MNESLTLNDGTVMENARAVQSTDLFLYFTGYTMKAVFDQLIEPEKTKTIIYTMMNGESVTYNNFQKLIAVRDEGGGMISAVMREVRG